MKITTHKESAVHANTAKTSESHEYPVGDKDIDCALVKVDGEYPGNGKFAVNTKSKELLFVLKGEGTIQVKGGETKSFGQYDAILIEKGELYKFLARAFFCIVCNPPWTPEQCETKD